MADSTMDTRDWDDEDEARELLVQSLLALIHPVFVDVEGHCTGDGLVLNGFEGVLLSSKQLNWLIQAERKRTRAMAHQ